MGKILLFAMLLIMGGVVAGNSLMGEQQSRVDEVKAIGEQVRLYSSYVTTAARADRNKTGTLTRQAAGVPDQLVLEPSMSNYVSKGRSYVFFTPPSPAFGNEIARQCGEGAVCGLKNAAGMIVVPGTGQAVVPAPAAAAVGAFVMASGEPDQLCTVPTRDTTIEKSDETRTAYNCPAGKYGWTLEGRTKERRVDITCDLASGTQQFAYGDWSNPTIWKDVAGQGDCRDCTPNSTERETQWVGASSYSCPAGQFGIETWQAENARTRTVSYSCPGKTSAPLGPNYGGWSGWSATGASRNNSRSCSSCPGPVQETNYQWVNVDVGCPSGQVGSHTYQKQQVQTRTRSYNCPAGTATSPGPSYSGWSGWSDTGAIQNQVVNCRPAVQYGTFHQNRACYAGYGVNSYNSCDYALESELFSKVQYLPGRYGLPCTERELWDGRACDSYYESAPTPAQCVVGQVYYYGNESRDLNTGQSGQVQDWTMDINVAAIEYVCR
ncbi:MAG: hypothetical protein VB135_00575 [Burkholderia sp.]